APRALAVDDPAPFLFRQLRPRHVGADAALPRETQQVVLTFGVARALERLDRPFAQRLRRIGDHETIVDADRPPEAAARLARADRRVERERVRNGIGVRAVAVGAM